MWQNVGVTKVKHTHAHESVDKEKNVREYLLLVKAQGGNVEEEREGTSVFSWSKKDRS